MFYLFMLNILPPFWGEPVRRSSKISVEPKGRHVPCFKLGDFPICNYCPDIIFFIYYLYYIICLIRLLFYYT